MYKAIKSTHPSGKRPVDGCMEGPLKVASVVGKVYHRYHSALRTSYRNKNYGISLFVLFWCLSHIYISIYSSTNAISFLVQSNLMSI